jgi:MFS family permease
MFETNMGSVDRILRAVVGIVLIAGFFLLPELSWRWVFWIGIVPLATALIGWCPAYTLFGWSSDRQRSVRRHG